MAQTVMTTDAVQGLLDHLSWLHSAALSGDLDARRPILARLEGAEAVRRKLPVLTMHEDPGVSGKTLQRPGLTAALSDLRLGEGSVLVVAKLDRLSRSIHNATGLMQRGEKQGWGLVATNVCWWRRWVIEGKRFAGDHVAFLVRR